MLKLNETAFGKKVKIQFPVTFKVHGALMQQGGWPDFYFAAPYGHGWLELKVGKNTCSDNQRDRITKLRKLGVFAAVVTLRENKLIGDDWSCAVQIEYDDAQYVYCAIPEIAANVRVLLQYMS